MNGEARHAAAVRAVLETLPSDSFVKQQMTDALNMVDEVIGTKSREPTAEGKEAKPSAAASADASAPESNFARISSAISTEAEPRGGGDCLALAVHSLIRSSGFIATTFEAVQGAATVPGFAAPLRLQDLPSNRNFPKNWQSLDGGDGCCTFKYRDAKRTAYTLRTVNLGGLLAVHFGPSEGGSQEAQGVGVSGPRTIELSVEKYVSMKDRNPEWHCTKELEASVNSLTAPEPSPVAPPGPAVPDPQPPQNVPKPSDLHGTFPGRHGDFNGDLGRGGAPGNLMGPNHPMFQPRGDPQGPAPSGPHLPRPRFDPYGPVPGPGGPSRPDHDHIRIPHFDDDPFGGGGMQPPPFGPMGGGPGFGPMGGDPLADNNDPLRLPTRGRGNRAQPRGPLPPQHFARGPPPGGMYD